MTAGLPGAGIGGLFYLIAALLTPAWEVVRACRFGTSPQRWRLVLRHFLLAVSILGGMWTAGWLIGVVASSTFLLQTTDGAAAVDPRQMQALGRRMTLVAMTTLVCVLAAVELLRLLVPRECGRDAARQTRDIGVLAASRVSVGDKPA